MFRARFQIRGKDLPLGQGIRSVCNLAYHWLWAARMERPEQMFVLRPIGNSALSGTQRRLSPIGAAKVPAVEVEDQRDHRHLESNGHGG